jgi:hypothetical protein
VAQCKTRNLGPHSFTDAGESRINNGERMKRWPRGRGC